jgi:multicomponent Na+:H+ antiporter subunit C
MTWYLIAAIFLVGIWGIISQRNLIKKILGLSISNSAIIMFFVYFGSLSGEGAPILDKASRTVRPVDPLPQALMLTAIVVGICIVALGLVLVYLLYKRYGTLDMAEIERKVWKSDD